MGKRTSYDSGRYDEDSICRFFAKVSIPSSPDECWVWTASLYTSGYGQFFYRDHMIRAHRYCYEIFHGPIPEGLWALHRCDNRTCVNPTHIFLGTPLDNVIDMTDKGRRNDAFGERSSSHKLHESDVPTIRELWSSGVSLKKLGRMYGMSSTAIRSVVRRTTWGHIPG